MRRTRSFSELAQRPYKFAKMIPGTRNNRFTSDAIGSTWIVGVSERPTAAGLRFSRRRKKGAGTPSVCCGTAVWRCAVPRAKLRPQSNACRRVNLTAKYMSSPSANKIRALVDALTRSIFELEDEIFRLYALLAATGREAEITDKRILLETIVKLRNVRTFRDVLCPLMALVWLLTRVLAFGRNPNVQIFSFVPDADPSPEEDAKEQPPVKRFVRGRFFPFPTRPWAASVGPRENDAPACHFRLWPFCCVLTGTNFLYIQSRNSYCS